MRGRQRQTGRRRGAGRRHVARMGSPAAAEVVAPRGRPRGCKRRRAFALDQRNHHGDEHQRGQTLRVDPGGQRQQAQLAPEGGNTAVNAHEAGASGPRHREPVACPRTADSAEPLPLTHARREDRSAGGRGYPPGVNAILTTANGGSIAKERSSCGAIEATPGQPAAHARSPTRGGPGFIARAPYREPTTPGAPTSSCQPTDPDLRRHTASGPNLEAMMPKADRREHPAGRLSHSLICGFACLSRGR
jgi:hypothetical protein